ncbi:hypothetical protein AAVH_36986, partial [Aphelenchoides avenae]
GHSRHGPRLRICWRWGQERETEPLDGGSLARFRNAYVESMGLYSGAERCVPLLNGLSNASNFEVGRLHYVQNLQETEETLERSVNWIVRDLRMTEYKLALWDGSGDNNDRALLPTTLTHDSVRGKAEYLFAD